jgi:hypothetical protein
MSRRPGQSRPGSDSFSIPALVHGRPKIFSAPSSRILAHRARPKSVDLERSPQSSPRPFSPGNLSLGGLPQESWPSSPNTHA